MNTFFLFSLVSYAKPAVLLRLATAGLSSGRDVMDVSVMGGREAEDFVVRLLKERGPLTTMEIEQLARKDHKRCPDQTVMFLTKMRKKGLVRGEVSLEKRGWLWSLP